MKQARFWHYHKGLVLIKLDRGQTVTHCHGGSTDEGYSWNADTYSFDGEIVTLLWSNQARDCDGRYDRDGISICHVNQLHTGPADQDIPFIRFPEWQHGDTRNRDYSAEAMGY
jgi:hypothetical protein